MIDTDDPNGGDHAPRHYADKRAWISIKIPQAASDQEADPRRVHFAYRTRAAAVYVAMAVFERGVQLFIVDDPVLAPTIRHIADGYPPLVGPNGIVDRLYVENRGDPHYWADNILKQGMDCAFFAGGSIADVFVDAERALAKTPPVACFALASTGPGADAALGLIDQIRGVPPHVRDVLKHEISLPVAIDACFKEIGL